MSKSIAAVLGVALALAGYALGRYGGGASVGGGPSASGLAGRESLSEVLREGDPIARAGRLAALLQTLGPDAAPQAREILMQPQFDFAMAELELLVRAWALQDPKAATGWAFEHAPPGCTLAAIAPPVEVWATRAPREVVESLRTTLRGSETRPAELALIRGWFASGEPGADEYIRDMGIGVDRQRLAGVLAALMIARDGPEAVQRWAEGLPDDDKTFKLDVFRQVGAELGKAAPEAAVAWCDRHCDGPYGQNVRALIALHWGTRDGRATMEWLAAQPEGQERDYAVQSGYMAWMRRDRDAAMAWVTAKGITGLPPWFRPAVGRYVMSLARDNPVAATEWAELIPDPENRELALITVFKHWRYRDETAAEAWLANSPLSEEAREKARKRAPTELPSLAPKAPPPPS